MAFEWREYLNLARFLQGQSGAGFSQEAAFRSAVSRAYYAAFCHARNYARDRHSLVLKNDVSDHSLVRRHFKSRREKKIADRLDNLRQWRDSCDYDDSVENIPLLLSSALAEAQKVLDTLR